MDELGVTAALDCFSSGDLGACGETALNIASSFAGGIAGKIAKKYAWPTEWGKAAALAKKLGGLALDLVDGVKDWFKTSEKVEKAKGALVAAKDRLKRSKACEVPEPHSFLPGTQVLMADGTRRNIEDVRPGDEITTTDPTTGETVVRTVAGTIVTEDDKDFVTLSVATGTGDASLVTTVTHPFWVKGEGDFVDAGELKPGSELLTPDGNSVWVKSLDFFEKRQKTHDLTIDDIHAYYVVAGNAPVLVHNAGGRGSKDPLNFGSNYTGRVDRFDIGGTTDFEVHVYHKGKEVGIFGSDGWFSKHGKSADVDVPRDVYNNLKGLAVGELRRDGRIGDKGTENVKGDNWKRPRITGGGC